MALEVRETIRRYRYLGIELPAPPGFTAEQVRDLHSTLYPELVSADIEPGEIVNGVQEITFKRAVGTKGTRLRRLREAVEAGADEPGGADAIFSNALDYKEVALCSSIWESFARGASRVADGPVTRRLPAWRVLPPVA